VDFAQALTALMDERGISGCELARRVYCDRSLIYRYRRGKQAPSVKLAHALDEALDAGGLLMDLARPSRRTVLAGGLLAGAMAIAPETAERLAWAQRHPPRIDQAAVNSLADVLAAQRHADDLLGSNTVLGPGLAQLTGIENMVKQARGPVRPALVSVAAQWEQFGGWLCRNTADFKGAQGHIANALELAEELGDRTMISTALANKSEIAAYSGAAGSAIGLAQAAQRDPKAATGQRAHAAEFEARGHAMAGDAAAADRKLGEAADLALTLADKPQDRRPWSYWMTPEFFNNEAGITCSYLAADPRWHARAVQLLGTADDEGVWIPAQNFTYLAFAHTRAGAVDQTCAAGVQAAAAVRQAGSVRMAGVLGQVHANLQARYPSDPRVRELAEALA
jgi:transcriptional regulator with XRE-family HTH domain